MTIRRIGVSLAVMLAVAVSASAGQRGGDRRRSGGERDRGQAVERRVPPPYAHRAAPVPHVYQPRVYSAPRPTDRPRAYSPRFLSPRLYAEPRYVRPRYVAPRVYEAPRYVRPYPRPYYTFRPRVSLGFGIWAGEPVPYPAYAYPVPYPVPYAYPYPAYPPPYPASAYPPPGTIAPSAFGGLSFDISPSDAQVYVDDQYVGLISDFAGTSRPLSLTPGRHHVDVQADGYVPLVFDVDVIAGQVMPYRGDLRPY